MVRDLVTRGLLGRKRKAKVSQEAKGSLTVVEEVAVAVVEEAAEVEMVQQPVTLPTRQSKPKIDNSEDPHIHTGVEQSEVTP